MDYKELLNRCKTQPGWLSTKEQRESESRLKYRTWVNELDEEYMRSMKTAANKSTLGNKT